MLTAESLRGIWAGLPLAWDQQDELDHQRYASDIERCLDLGGHGVYAAGSTGEFYALDVYNLRSSGRRPKRWGCWCSSIRLT